MNEGKQAVLGELLKDVRVVYVDDKPRFLESIRALHEVEGLEVISARLYSAKFDDYLWGEIIVDERIYDGGPYDVIARGTLKQLLDGMEYKENERGQKEGAGAEV